MLGIGNTLKKFNLLFLEEGEHYIQDFFGRVRYYDLYAQTHRVQEALIHFCSRSIIIEFSKDPTQPLYKYLLKNFKKEPFLNVYIDKNDKNLHPMCVYCSRLVEVPINSSAPKPYLLHDSKKIEDLPNKEFELQLNIEFQDIAEFFNALRDLYHLYKQKGHSYESDLDTLIFSYYNFSK